MGIAGYPPAKARGPTPGTDEAGPGAPRVPAFPGKREDTGIALPQNDLMDTTTAWIFVIVFWLAPIVHVATSPRSGPARPPEGARCPFGPRVGWLVIVVLLGAVGWLLFMNAKFRRRAAADRDSG